MTLSVCAIVKNEEKNLLRLLENIKDIADEIVINDTGSTDRTKTIASTFTGTYPSTFLQTKLYETTWQHDFSAAKNFCLEKATSDWILFLDADETINQPKNILKYTKESTNRLYMLKIYNLGCESTVFNTSIRLFPRHHLLRYHGKVHEYLSSSGFEKIVIPDLQIIHYGYQDKKISREKALRNLVILEKAFTENTKGTPEYYHQAFLMGKELAACERYEESLTYFELCLTFKNISEKFLINTVTFILKIWALLNRWDKAGELGARYEKLCVQNPDFCIIYGTYFHEILKLPELAEQWYLKAHRNEADLPDLTFELASATWKPYFFTGIIYMQKNDNIKAEYFFEKAAEYTDRIWQLNFHITSLYLKTGNIVKAKDFFAKSENLFPSHVRLNLLKQLNNI